MRLLTSPARHSSGHRAGGGAIWQIEPPCGGRKTISFKAVVPSAAEAAPPHLLHVSDHDETPPRRLKFEWLPSRLMPLLMSMIMIMVRLIEIHAQHRMGLAGAYRLAAQVRSDPSRRAGAAAALVWEAGSAGWRRASRLRAASPRKGCIPCLMDARWRRKRLLLDARNKSIKVCSIYMARLAANKPSNSIISRPLASNAPTRAH